MRHQHAFSRGLLLAGALLGAGCTTVVVPPAGPTDPRPVFLLDHGRHATLVVPEPGTGALVRYAYGDWDWYALVETGPGKGSAALLWPTRAGLGRRRLPGPPTAEAVRRQVRVGIQAMYRLEVDGRAAAALHGRLEQLFRSNLSTRVHNRQYDLEFVHHPEAYSAFHNSNQVVAGWLRDLGCEVQGSALVSRWSVREPETQE